MAEDQWKQLRQVLADRVPITPDDLPAFGARVSTTSGHTMEILGWFGPNPAEVPPYGHQRIALAIVTDGVTPARRCEGGLATIGD